METSHSKTDTCRPIEKGLDGYRSVSLWAILSIVLGIASPLATIGPILWIVPGLGIVVCIVAIRDVAANRDHLIGRKAAVFGLALSLLFFTAAISDAATRRWWLDAESRAVAEQWFKSLCEEKPALAIRMMPARSLPVPPPSMGMSDGSEIEKPKDPVQEFVKEPLIHFLLAHGKKAQIRYWSTEVAGAVSNKFDGASIIYAVTWLHDERKESFFVRLNLRREWEKTMKEGAWTVTQFEGGVNPFKDEDN